MAVGICEHLAATTGFTWRSDGAYTATEHALTIKTVPAGPDVVAAVTVYDVDDDPDPRQVRRTFAVQVRFRAPGRPDAVDVIAQEAKDALHGEHHSRFGQVPIARCARVSVAQLGPDAGGRHERTDNYRIVTARTQPGGTP
ncbi:minor capsid protein [Cellulomonas sp. RIT-PI-Y]|uniref:minor capsid protein n=1 Tax=Cellulomonas sp. RIT-PI-Y TaxID=3035297 RepID=UPI0021D9DA4E|nr:minor capsid protein [Cellulomonas sp. RIT-PI-Y]